jgi:6-phosphogluconolactonase
MRVFADAQLLAQAAVESFVLQAREAISGRGQFCVALAGGSTPKQIYQLLAQQDLPWQQIHLFWGDERCVPPTDPRSNYRMVQEVLLNHISIPLQNIHRIKAEQGTNQAIADYQHQLETVLGASGFDLVHLGIGTDGHTASLFPATPDIAPPVLSGFPTPELEPQVARISLGLSVLNAARVKQFFVMGEGKRAIWRRLQAGEDLPAARVQQAEWWLEQVVLEGLAT